MCTVSEFIRIFSALYETEYSRLKTASSKSNIFSMNTMEMFTRWPTVRASHEKCSTRWNQHFVYVNRNTDRHIRCNLKSNNTFEISMASGIWEGREGVKMFFFSFESDWLIGRTSL